MLGASSPTRFSIRFVKRPGVDFPFDSQVQWSRHSLIDHHPRILRRLQFYSWWSCVCVREKHDGNMTCPRFLECFAIYWVWPPPSSSDHQNYYIFSRGSLQTFISHCYKPYKSIASWWFQLPFCPNLGKWSNLTCASFSLGGKKPAPREVFGG